MDATAVIEELTLMLMYLTSWRERNDELRRCWKGYDFTALDRLDQQGLITNSHRAKSVHLTREGEDRARHLLNTLGLPVD
jgi:hypothetical protein